jgi:hypothetical protein
MSNNMKASDISEVMEELFGGPAFTESRLFAYCMTRGELMLMTDGKAGRTAGRTRGQAVFVPEVCGQCERAIGGLGEGAGKVEVDDSVLRTTTAFERVEKWCGGKVEVVRQVQRVEDCPSRSRIWGRDANSGEPGGISTRGDRQSQSWLRLEWEIAHCESCEEVFEVGVQTLVVSCA